MARMQYYDPSVAPQRSLKRTVRQWKGGCFAALSLLGLVILGSTVDRLWGPAPGTQVSALWPHTVQRPRLAPTPAVPSFGTLARPRVARQQPRPSVSGGPVAAMSTAVPVDGPPFGSDAWQQFLQFAEAQQADRAVVRAAAAFVARFAADPFAWPAPAGARGAYPEVLRAVADPAVTAPGAAPVTVLVVVPAGSPSPLNGASLAGVPSPTLEGVMQRMAQRVAWVDPAIHLEVFTKDSIAGLDFASARERAQVLVAVGVQDPEFVAQVQTRTQGMENAVFLECHESLSSHISPRHLPVDLLGWLQQVAPSVLLQAL